MVNAVVVVLLLFEIAGCVLSLDEKLNFQHKKFQYYSETLLVLCMRLFTFYQEILQVSQE